jgi:hypothetical protein
MAIYKIHIPPSLYFQIGLGKTTYSQRQPAIDALVKGFEQAKMTFRIEENSEKIVFLNESGGELAAVVPSY